MEPEDFPIPNQENTATILVPDALFVDYHCPFCGTRAFGKRDDEYVVHTCEHLMFAELSILVHYVSPVLGEEIKKLLPAASDQEIYEAALIRFGKVGDLHKDLAVSSFCRTVANSITFNSFDPKTGEECIVSYRYA